MPARKGAMFMWFGFAVGGGITAVVAGVVSLVMRGSIVVMSR